MLLLLLIMFLIILCLIERELDSQRDSIESVQESCHKCGIEISGEHLICTGCGSLLREHCTSCGKSKQVSHHFCIWCGEDSSKSRSLYAA